jgi:hypothetical protein
MGNTLKLDTSAFDRMVSHLRDISGDVRKAVTDALEQSGETITEDTQDAVSAGNLPAGGKYSYGNTAESIVSPKVTWVGGVQAEMGVGFDYSKPGAGGFLITGTPRMRPDMALKRIYKQKTYMRNIQQDMCDVVEDYIVDALRGGG